MWVVRRRRPSSVVCPGSHLEKKLAQELPRDACVLAARFPLATWTETRHDVHTVKSRGFYVNQLWEYELDPAVRALREEPDAWNRLTKGSATLGFKHAFAAGAGMIARQVALGAQEEARGAQLRS